VKLFIRMLLTSISCLIVYTR